MDKDNTSSGGKHRSLPLMFSYELTLLLGLRTMHLSRGAPPLVDLPPDFKIERNMQLRAVVVREILEKKLPYVICRPMPNGKVEKWPVSELNLEGVMHLLRE